MVCSISECSVVCACPVSYVSSHGQFVHVPAPAGPAHYITRSEAGSGPSADSSDAPPPRARYLSRADAYSIPPLASSSYNNASVSDPYNGRYDGGVQLEGVGVGVKSGQVIATPRVGRTMPERGYASEGPPMKSTLQSREVRECPTRTVLP